MREFAAQHSRHEGEAERAAAGLKGPGCVNSGSGTRGEGCFLPWLVAAAAAAAAAASASRPMPPVFPWLKSGSNCCASVGGSALSCPEESSTVED